MDDIKKEFGEIVSSGSLGSLEDLSRQHTSLTDQWSDINKTVDDLHEKFHRAVNNWATLKGQLTLQPEVYLIKQSLGILTFSP